MRRIPSGWLLVFLLCLPAWSKKTEVEAPLFMAPDFRFSQVDTLCIAPAMDLRADKSQVVDLSTHGGVMPDQLVFLPQMHMKGMDSQLAADFKSIGYETANCNPISATLDDLVALRDAWLGALDFGQSRWLFIPAVEAARYWRGSRTGYAVLSGWLFEKAATGVRLVWRDRVVASEVGLQGGLFAKKGEVEESADDLAVLGGTRVLLTKFENRHKDAKPKEAPYVEAFNTPCATLWPILDDIVKNSGKYNLLEAYDSYKMVVYTIGAKELEEKAPRFGFHGTGEKVIEYAVLRGEGNGCEMHIILPLGARPTYHPYKELSKMVQERLAK